MGAIELIVIFGMIIFNAVFAAYEIALAAVSGARLQVLVNENRPGAKAACYMKENVEASLAAIQLGITLFGAIGAATGGAGAEQQIAPLLRDRFGLSVGAAEFLALAAVILPLTAVSIIFGELVPKVFALRNKESVCLRMSPGMRWFTYSVWPIVWLFETVVSRLTGWGERRLRKPDSRGRTDSAELQELFAITNLARTTRVIGACEERIILGAARLAARPLREIMLPASAISMLCADTTLADAMIAAHLDMHTRFPVTEQPGDPQRIIGYVNVKDLVAVMHLSPSQPSLRSVTRPLLRFAESDNISAGLERLLRDSAHIALVQDEAGRVTGLVTLEDVVEELLGDITDEYDRLPAYVKPSGSSWVIGGGISPAGLREATGLDLTTNAPTPPADTLGAWVAGHLGRVARGGDVVERNGIRVLVRKVRRHQVLEAQLSRID